MIRVDGCLIPAIFRLISGARGFATISSEATMKILTPEEMEALEIEKEIEKKRNKSRLSEAHYNRMHGRPSYMQPKHVMHASLTYRRKVYGKYGSESGFDPAICWMDKEDLEEAEEYERIAHPFSLAEMVAAAKEKKRLEQETIRERMEQIDKKVAKFHQWESEVLARKAKALAEATAAKEKKDRMVEEVRRHFGFKINPKDERFKTLLAEKEKEQKKEEKLAKRAAKEAKVLLRIQQKSAEIS